MTAPSSIDPAEFLHEHLTQASADLMRQMLTTFINTLLSADAGAVGGAGWGQVSDARLTQRNGYRHRDLDTRTGTLDVAHPQAPLGHLLPGVAPRASPSVTVTPSTSTKLTAYREDRGDDVSPST